MFVKKLRDILNQRDLEDNEDLVAAEQFLTENTSAKVEIDEEITITIGGPYNDNNN
jgi:hypothetical protein